VRADADLVLARRAAILARIDAHASDRPAGARTRTHGDYRLGRVLLVENDFVIIDFEGEPGRTPAQRREKHSALRDVASMLRSLDYAMHAAVARAAAERHDTRGDLEQLGRRWRQAARRAFLEGYEDAAAAGLASPTAEGRRLIELFSLEKVLYELAYEIDNRPDWSRIPLRGLMEVLEPQTAEEETWKT
jgi:maltose alpha-D-glucosyltransferase/alpha-amylase